MTGKRVLRNKKHKADIILLTLAIFLLVFIVCMIALFCVYQSVPDTLIQCVLGAGGVESLALAAIKIVKVKNGEATSPKESEESNEPYDS